MPELKTSRESDDTESLKGYAQSYAELLVERERVRRLMAVCRSHECTYQ